MLYNLKMNSKEINTKISRLARINESVGNIHFEAVHDEENTEWQVRMGIVRIVYSISEEEAKMLAQILNSALNVGVEKIISTNSTEIKSLIDFVPNQED